MLQIHPTILGAIQAGAAIALSISGGKDGQAMLDAVLPALRELGVQNKIFAIHADLGKMEWEQTPAFVQKLCDDRGLDLVVVRREQGDLLDHMRQRMKQLAGTGKPHFPSSAARYCTSDHKRTPIDKYLRQFDLVISAEGVRASESAARSKKPEWEYRKQICTQTRIAYNWRPILNWSDEQVWNALGSSQADIDKRRLLYACGHHRSAFDGWQGHPAYVLGNQRLSCAICVLASRNDIVNGAKHNPDVAAEIVAMERESGITFQPNFRLGSIK